MTAEDLLVEVIARPRVLHDGKALCFRLKGVDDVMNSLPNFDSLRGDVPHRKLTSVLQPLLHVALQKLLDGSRKIQKVKIKKS